MSLHEGTWPFFLERTDMFSATSAAEDGDNELLGEDERRREDRMPLRHCICGEVRCYVAERKRDCHGLAIDEEIQMLYKVQSAVLLLRIITA